MPFPFCLMARLSIKTMLPLDSFRRYKKQLKYDEVKQQEYVDERHRHRYEVRVDGCAADVFLQIRIFFLTDA